MELITSLIFVPLPEVAPVTWLSTVVQEITDPGVLLFKPIETASPLQSVGEAKVVIKVGIGFTVIIPVTAALLQFAPVLYTRE
jgi:hypothetical protein